MSTTEESLEKIAKRMFYIYSSKFEGWDWDVKIDNIQPHKYSQSNNYSISFNLVFNYGEFDNDITDIVCYDIKKIENECYDIFKRFYITEDLKLATDNEDQMDDIIAYLYYLVMDAPKGFAEFKLSFEYNYYFK
jgi:hypothetical protein